MPLFYFVVQGDFGDVVDREGIDLADCETARAYACGVARELMFGDAPRKRSWLIAVRDRDDNELFAVPFVTVDDSLRHLNAECRTLIEVNSKTRRGLAEALQQLRINVLRARATVARARSRPYVATENGKTVCPASD